MQTYDDMKPDTDLFSVFGAHNDAAYWRYGYIPVMNTYLPQKFTSNIYKKRSIVVF